MSAEPQVERGPAVPDDAAFLASYDQAVASVFRYLQRAVGGDRQRAEDITQEVFVYALRSYRGGNSAAVEIPWIMTLARHRLVDDVRRREREQRNLSIVHSSEVPGSDVLDSADLDGTTAAAALGALSQEQRLVLHLRYVDDLKVPAIAKLMERSVHATESLLVRARRAFEMRYREVDDA